MFLELLAVASAIAFGVAYIRERSRRIAVQRDFNLLVPELNNQAHACALLGQFRLDVIVSEDVGDPDVRFRLDSDQDYYDPSNLIPDASEARSMDKFATDLLRDRLAHLGLPTIQLESRDSDLRLVICVAHLKKDSHKYQVKEVQWVYRITDSKGRTLCTEEASPAFIQAIMTKNPDGEVPFSCIQNLLKAAAILQQNKDQARENLEAVHLASSAKLELSQAPDTVKTSQS